MKVSAISQAVVSSPEFASYGAVLVYDPAVDNVGELLAGLDGDCASVPPVLAISVRYLPGCLARPRSTRFICSGTVPRAAYSLKTFS